MMDITLKGVISPASKTASQSCRRVRVLMPTTSCKAVAKTRTVESVTVRSKSFLEKKIEHQSTRRLKLENFMRKTESQDIIKAGCSGKKSGKRSGIKRQLVRRRRHRKGHWSRWSMSCGRLAWQCKSQSLPGVDGNQQTGVDALSLSAGTVVKPMENSILLAIFSNQCSLEGLTPRVGEKALAALLFVCTHPNASGSRGMPRCWRSQKNGRSEPRCVRTTTFLCNLVGGLFADDSHTDNTVGAVPLSAKGAEFSVLGFSTTSWILQTARCPTKQEAQTRMSLSAN